MFLQRCPIPLLYGQGENPPSAMKKSYNQQRDLRWPHRSESEKILKFSSIWIKMKKITAKKENIVIFPRKWSIFSNLPFFYFPLTLLWFRRLNITVLWQSKIMPFLAEATSTKIPPPSPAPLPLEMFRLRKPSTNSPNLLVFYELFSWGCHFLANINNRAKERGIW